MLSPLIRLNGVKRYRCYVMKFACRTLLQERDPFVGARREEAGGTGRDTTHYKEHQLNRALHREGPHGHVAQAPHHLRDQYVGLAY